MEKEKLLADSRLLFTIHRDRQIGSNNCMQMRLYPEQGVQLFARHGIPEIVVSDNGPQFSAALYSNFAQSYGFDHITSSPYFLQSNGEAERAVGTIKRLLNKEEDPYMSLLAYRTTTLQNGYSPSELLMSRRLRSTVPISLKQHMPEKPDMAMVRNRDEEIKEKQKRNFDRRHRSTELPPLSPGDLVWLPSQEKRQ